MKRLFICTLMLLMFVGVSSAYSKTLTWIPPTAREDGSALAAADIGGYKVYCEDKAGVAVMLADVGNVLKYDISQACSKVYATAYDKAGFESKASNKLPAMPPAAPQCSW
jgi:hypothetical protein